LSIDEAKEAYYCYRDPQHHSGYNLNRLLVHCGVPYSECAELLNRHNSDIPPTPPPKKQPTSAAEARWQWFESAGDSVECLTYLRRRGFEAPGAVCKQYDLRFTREGKWAKRVMLPVRERGHVITWIGRTTDDELIPKYRTEPVDHPGYIYVPRLARDTLVIVEGSLDALKIAVATDSRPISSLALLGKGVNAPKLLWIEHLACNCKRILVALDADVTDPYAVIHELAPVVSCPIERLPVPTDFKDPADMTMGLINEWIP
jgi:hypothetical protein